MKATELMVGDWVYRHACYDQVKEIRHTGVIGIDSMRGLITFSELEPIPLTPEILEKNGFTGGEYKNYCGNVFYLSVDGFRKIGLTMSYKDNILWCDRIIPDYPNSAGDKYAIHRLDYVHQLQHAMRLCGIKKEIIV